MTVATPDFPPSLAATPGSAGASVTPAAPAPATTAFDPHAPKLSPSDPRLRLRRPAPRALRTAPLLVLGGGVLCAMLVAIGFALQPARAKVADHADPSAAPPAPPLPDSIRNAPSAPRPSPSPPRRDARTTMAEGHTAHAQAGTPNGAGSPSPEQVRKHLEEEEDFRARTTGILFDKAPGQSAFESERAPTLAPPALAPVPSAGSPGSGADSDPNFQERKNAFLEGLGLGSKSSDYLSASVQHPRSPYEIQAGTIIPAVLVTGITSDLPGPVIGQVRENVYDTVSGNFLLIPQGSRLLAHYDSMVAWGQERVLVCWQRLLFPNGDSIDLQCMPAADLKGSAGLTDEVDEHWWRIIKGAGVSSLLAATSAAAAGNTDGFQPTLPQIAARNAADQINSVGQQITRRNIMIQPTITVRPGFSVNVIVSKDMILPPYPEPTAPGGVP